MNESLLKLNLIKRTKTGKDSRNQAIYTETAHTVYGESIPITRNEYSSAGMIGIQPELAVKISAFDYHGETLLQYPAGEGGKKYRIYRTYEPNGNETELYAEIATGANGGTT